MRPAKRDCPHSRPSEIDGVKIVVILFENIAENVYRGFLGNTAFFLIKA